MNDFTDPVTYDIFLTREKLYMIDALQKLCNKMLLSFNLARLYILNLESFLHSMSQ